MSGPTVPPTFTHFLTPTERYDLRHYPGAQLSYTPLDSGGYQIDITTKTPEQTDEIMQAIKAGVPVIAVSPKLPKGYDRDLCRCGHQRRRHLFGGKVPADTTPDCTAKRCTCARFKKKSQHPT